MTVLAIDTSADDTSAAVVAGRRIISHVEYSQISLHEKWGGIFPTVARRAHEERIDGVVDAALRRAHVQFSEISGVAVTYGPGLAIALEVGIRKATDIARTYDLPLIPVNHMEGHLYSSFAQNRAGNPTRDYPFPLLGLLVSGGHTELILWKDHLVYEILGETQDDAAGEALDKASRMLGFGYPGGPVIERLAHGVGHVDRYHFPRPMMRSNDMNFSFSGLKTSLLYKVRAISAEALPEEISYLASSFQEAVMQTLVKKTRRAIETTGVARLAIGGGVSVNRRLRALLRAEVARYPNGHVYAPAYPYLNFDNAAMIGMVGALRLSRGLTLPADATLDRVPRLSLLQSTTG